MARKKMYFRSEDDEYCYDKQDLLDEMKDEGITEMMVFEAVPDNSKENFFCKAAGYCFLSPPEGERCGRDCEDYEPKNGKSGMCKYKRKTYDWGKEVVIKLKQKEEAK